MMLASMARARFDGLCAGTFEAFFAALFETFMANPSDRDRGWGPRWAFKLPKDIRCHAGRKILFRVLNLLLRSAVIVLYSFHGDAR